MTHTVSTPTHIKAKLGLHDVPDMDVVKALTTAHDGVLHNPAYPVPPFDMATFKAEIDRFSALIIDAEDGGKRAISAKNKQRRAALRSNSIRYKRHEAVDSLCAFCSDFFRMRRW